MLDFRTLLIILPCVSGFRCGVSLIVFFIVYVGEILLSEHIKAIQHSNEYSVITVSNHRGYLLISMEDRISFHELSK